MLNVRDVLARLPGMGDVRTFGAGDYSMRLWLDPRKLAARNLHYGRRGRRGARTERPGRRRSDRRASGPAPPEFQVALNSMGRLQDEQQFREIIIKTGTDGQIVRLGDVARIELGAQDYALRGLLSNQNAVALPFFQSPRLECPAALRKTSTRRWKS